MISKSTLFAMALCGFNEIFSHNCHAMLIGLTGEARSTVSLTLMLPPIAFVAQGSSVPISRGRPPGVSIQA